MPHRLTSYQIRIVVAGVFSIKGLVGWSRAKVDQWSDLREKEGARIEQIIDFAEEAVDYWQEDGAAKEEVKDLASALDRARYVPSSTSK